MTYEKFLQITLSLQKRDRVLQNLYDNGVDLINFIDPYTDIIHQLMEEIYGKEGAEWFSWFCWENEFGNGGLEAWDEEKNPICYSHESLWEFLEKEYTTKKDTKDAEHTAQ